MQNCELCEKKKSNFTTLIMAISHSQSKLLKIVSPTVLQLQVKLKWYVLILMNANILAKCIRMQKWVMVFLESAEILPFAEIQMVLIHVNVVKDIEV